MIEAADLRVGNIIELQLTTNGLWYPIRVSGIKLVKGTAFISWTDHVGEFMVLNEHFRAIGITPDVLRKCGFEKDNMACWVNKTLKLNGGSVTVFSGNPWAFWCYLGEIRVHLQDLHQLQNLFFSLYGEDLNVPLL